jgi:hypothetical protein
MAWALIDGLGSGNARDAFHVVSSYSSKYDPKNTDQYFDRFVNSYDSSNPRAITKATFFARAKEHGLSIQSEKTKRVITAVKAATSSKKTRHQAVAEITATEEISESEAHSITDAVYDARNEFHDESTPEDTIEHVLSTYGKFEYNEITRKIEITNMDLQRASMNDTIFNDVFIFTRKSIPKKPPSDRMVQAIIHSSYSTPYNPIKEFLHASKPKHKGKTDAIRAIADSLITQDGNTEKTFRYIKKWLVATARMWDTGEPNPYMCIIIGKQQGTGKTTFFRRLIPSQITPYYSETRLSGSKDDLILATEKAVILVDELAGLHKTDWDFIKQMLTQKIITARPSYGRYAVDLPRIAAWAGTSNQTELLRDESNRRFLVLNVLDINREKYNAVEKSDLFAEAYFLHLAGEDKNETIDEYNDLSEDADKYRITTLEETLIEQHYIHPDVAREVMDISKINPRNVKNSAEIIEEINKKTNFSHKLNSRLIGSALNRLDFPKIDGRSYRKNRYCWLVFERSDHFMDV